jgi:hypothetical protein
MVKCSVLADLGSATIFRETQRFVFDEEPEGSILELRLLYKGRLPAETSRPRVHDKHHIRRCFHAQLKELWSRYPPLDRQRTEKLTLQVTPVNLISHPGGGVKEVVSYVPGSAPEGAKPWVEHVAEMYRICGFRFVPLVRKEAGFTCSLKILFLRRGHPGELISSGGDIDNRVKVLFDGLKMPKNYGEIQATPEHGEDPFFCLLEDDSLITTVEITTDRLLTPLIEDESETDVELVVHVTVIDPQALFGSTGLI